MHPIERLRYVARASGADHVLLAQEAADTLGAFRGDPAGLVTACRRLLLRHPTSGPLWWLASRVLCAPDAMVEAWAAADQLEGDTTGRALVDALPDDATIVLLGWPDVAASSLPRRGDVTVLVVDTLGEGSGLVHRLERADVVAFDVPVSGLAGACVEADVVVLEASAVGPERALAVAGSRAAAATARHAGREVWLTAGVGRLLPARVYDVLAARLEEQGDPWDLDDEEVPLDLITTVVGPHGPQGVADALKRTDCPIAPELFATTPSFSQTRQF